MIKEMSFAVTIKKRHTDLYQCVFLIVLSYIFYLLSCLLSAVSFYKKGTFGNFTSSYIRHIIYEKQSRQYP